MWCVLFQVCVCVCTLAAALSLQAVQDLLVLPGLVVVLLQVGGAVAGVLGQHQLDVPTQRQTLAVEQQHPRVQSAAHRTVGVWRGGRAADIDGKQRGYQKMYLDVEEVIRSTWNTDLYTTYNPSSQSER